MGDVSRVLCAIDLSGHARTVLSAAQAIAEKDQGVVRVVHVVQQHCPPLTSPPRFARAIVREQVSVHFRQWLVQAQSVSPTPVQGRLRQGHPAKEILAEAEEWGADLIVVGSHRPGFFERLLMGSTSRYVLRHGRHATLVVPLQHAHGKAVGGSSCESRAAPDPVAGTPPGALSHACCPIEHAFQNGGGDGDR